MSKLMGHFPSPPDVNDPMSTRKWNHEMAQWKSLVWEQVKQSQTSTRGEQKKKVLG